jgi:hypothetical protein
VAAGAGGAGSGDLHYWRQQGDAGTTTGGRQEAVYAWGRERWETSQAGNYTLTADEVMILPNIFTRSCTISALHYVNYSGVGTGFRIALYLNRTDNLLYPGARAWQSDAYLPAHLERLTMAPALAVTAPAVLWLAVNSAPATMGGTLQTMGQFTNELVHLGGCPVDAWQTGSPWNLPVHMPWIGWRLPLAYDPAGLPETMPIGAGEQKVISLNNGASRYPLPAIGYQVSYT